MGGLFENISSINLGFADKGLHHWLVSIETNQPYLKSSQIIKLPQFLRPKKLPQIWLVAVATKMRGKLFLCNGNLMMLLINLLIRSRAWSRTASLRCGQIRAQVEVVEWEQAAIAAYVFQRTMDPNLGRNIGRHESSNWGNETK